DSTLTLRGSWTNTATVTVSNALLNLRGNWRNAGVINATDATVDLGGTFSLSGLGVFNRSGGTTMLTGTLDNGGGPMALDATTGSWVMNGGTLRSTVLTATGGTQLIFGSGTLDGVTVTGDLDLTGSGANATVVNGLALNGTANLGNQTNANTWGYLNFDGSQTLSGSGAVVFGRHSCNLLRVATGGTTLTVEPGMTVRGHSGRIGWDAGQCIGGAQNVGVVNQGTIAADLSGGTIVVRALPF